MNDTMTKRGTPRKRAPGAGRKPKPLPLTVSARGDGPPTVALRGLLTVRELAERLRLSEQHVRNLTRDLDIPHFRVGRSIRYEPEAVDRWLAEHRVGGR